MSLRSMFDLVLAVIVMVLFGPMAVLWAYGETMSLGHPIDLEKENNHLPTL